MEYKPVLVYDATDGEFIGYAIKKVGVAQFQSINLWGAATDDFKDALKRLNESSVLRENWPNGDDPEVVTLLADESFEPAPKIAKVVIDPDASTPVDKDTLPDVYTDIKYKTIYEPSSDDLFKRRHKAQEVVARRRAGLSS
jgi:hypothetical protein